MLEKFELEEEGECPPLERASVSTPGARRGRGAGTDGVHAPEAAGPSRPPPVRLRAARPAGAGGRDAEPAERVCSGRGCLSVAKSRWVLRGARNPAIHTDGRSFCPYKPNWNESKVTCSSNCL